MRLEVLESLIEVHNELEVNESRHINAEEVMANISSPDDEYEIEQFIGFVLARIENTESAGE